MAKRTWKKRKKPDYCSADFCSILISLDFKEVDCKGCGFNYKESKIIRENKTPTGHR